MHPRKILGAAVFAAVAGAASAGDAAVLYSNGPYNGTFGAYTINSGLADSFTLTQASTVTGVDFVSWAHPGDTMTSVDWSITPTANSFPAGTTANVTQSSICAGCAFGYYDINNEIFSTGSVSLAAGAYYLVLQNAVVGNGDQIFWDVNSGPSTAYQTYAGQIPSETFQILGTTSAVPEPSTWAMMLAGFLGLGFAGYRRSQRVAA